MDPHLTSSVQKAANSNLIGHRINGINSTMLGYYIITEIRGYILTKCHCFRRVLIANLHSIYDGFTFFVTYLFDLLFRYRNLFV